MMFVLLSFLLFFPLLIRGQVNMFKLSQGTDPTRMTITWSSQWMVSTTRATPNSQCRYSTDRLSLTLSSSSTSTTNIPTTLYAEGSVDSYQFQAYSSATLFPIYSSPLLHYVKLTNLIPGTRYFYVCGDFSGQLGTDFQDPANPSTFKTLPAVGSAVDTEGNYLIFGVYMDSAVATFQNPVTGVNDPATLASNNNQFVGSDHRNTIAAIVANTEAPVSMVLHAGDMSYADCNQPVWDTYDLLLEPMSKSIPFHASAGNHEQEQTYAQDGKTIFTAMEKRYRFGAIPAVFTGQSTATGITSTNNAISTTTAIMTTSDKLFASSSTTAIVSYGTFTTAAAITVNEQRTDPFNTATPNAVTGSHTDNLYKCQQSNGGVGIGFFRGAYDYGNSYYSYNAGLAHIVFLNPYIAYEAGSRQYNWLAADLAAVNNAQTPWVFVLTHGPLYNTNIGKHATPGGKDPNGNSRWIAAGQDQEEWGLLLAIETPLLWKFKVNFVLAGHVHNTERFLGMYNGTSNAAGTVYMTLGAGGATMDTGGFPPFTCPAGSTSCVPGKRFTQSGTVACASRTTVGTAVTGEDDCCSGSNCWNPTAAGNKIQNALPVMPTQANGWTPFFPTSTYWLGSVFRNDYYYGYGTFAIISRDVVQYSYYATTQALGGSAVSATYQGPTSKTIVDTAVCMNAQPQAGGCVVDQALICNTKGAFASTTCPSSVTRVSTTKGSATGGIPVPPVVIPVTIIQQIDSITLAMAQQATNQNAYKGALAMVLGTLPGNIIITNVAQSSRRSRSLLQRSGVIITTYTTDAGVTATTAAAAATTTAMNNAMTRNGLAWTTSIAPTIGSGLTTAVAAGPTPAAAPGTGTVTIGTNTASNACFADSEVVTMENGMTKSIAEVQIGDRILSADVQGKTSFSDVVYVPHGANTIEATFVLLTTESGRNVKMTTNHILPAGQCGGATTVRRADAVSTGDCVMTVDGVEKVMDMVTMRGKGIYTVVTNKEYIVVNGIVATPFGGVNPTLANIYYNLHRLMYAFMPQVMMSVSNQHVMEQIVDVVASFVL